MPFGERRQKNKKWSEFANVHISDLKKRQIFSRIIQLKHRPQLVFTNFQGNKHTHTPQKENSNIKNLKKNEISNESCLD